MNTSEKINPNTLTYNELRRACKELNISSGLSSSPTKADLIKTIENHYKSQKPEITQQAKDLKKETPELKSVPLKEIVETIAINNFQEALQKVKDFLKKTNEEKIALYKSLSGLALQEINTNTSQELNSLLQKEGTKDVKTSVLMQQVVSSTSKIVSDIIEVEAVEDSSEIELEKLANEVSNTKLSDDEQALVDSLLSGTSSSDEEDDEENHY